MLSISGSIVRLSWFISNSYSKSEMARSPFTIAVAPFSLANATSRLSKDFISTFSRDFTSARMNSIRSSVGKTVFDPFRTGLLTTATTTRSNTEEARVMMSKCPNVTGSYVPGQSATPRVSSGIAVNPDACGAIVAFELEREAELQRGALVRFGHDAGVFREDRWEQMGEALSQRGRRTIWRVEKDEVELAVL